ncbi:MAG: AAA family ATPase [Muribaculaceae bacterium]|nr:AAA family ATPase [Muribaculaceae bacterium]
MDSITVKGYKSFKDITVPMSKINILIGSNGAGKSNFLSLFALLGNAYNGLLARSVALSGGIDKLFHKGRKVTDRISIEVKEGNNSYGLDLMEADGTLIVEKEKLGYASVPGKWTYLDIANFKPETSLREYRGLSSGSYINKYMSQIKKFHFHDTSYTSPFTGESNIGNDSYFLYPQGGNLAAFLYGIMTNHPMVYKRIVRVIQSVAPFFNDFYLAPNERGGLRLQWRDKFSDVVYGPNDLSDGTLRFIALTVLFLQPEPPKVIVIDEPELGLHPVAIEKLAGLIKSAANRGTQVIVATQNAELIGNFDPEDILTVDQRDGESAIKRLDARELSHWLNDYTLGDLWKQRIMKGGQPV